MFATFISFCWPKEMKDFVRKICPKNSILTLFADFKKFKRFASQLMIPKYIISLVKIYDIIHFSKKRHEMY